MAASQEVRSVPTEMIGIKWVFEDFLTNQSRLRRHLRSESFPEESLPQWHMKMFQYEGKFEIWLMLSKAKTGRFASAECRLSLRNDDGAQLRYVHSRKVNFYRGIGWETGLSLGVKNADVPTVLSQSGKLIVQVTISFKGKVVSLVDRIPIPKSSITERWMKLLKSGDNSDFDIESADGQIFPVHKLVLSVSNPNFFALMMSNGMKEAKDSRVKLPFDAETIADLLEYLYTDDIVNLSPTASARLYPAAHQYQLDRLVVICAANLCRNLSVDNISVVLHIAKLSEDVKLLSVCEEFISGHKSVRKFLSAEDYQLPNPSVATKIRNFFRRAN